MTWLDWLTIALLLAGVVQGVTRGWIGALLGAGVALFSFVMASAFYPLYSRGVGSLPMPAEWARAGLFTIVFAALHVMISLIVGSFLGGKRARIEAQVPGGVVGLGRGVVVAMAVLGILAATPHEAIKEDFKSSPIAGLVLRWEQSFMHSMNATIRITPIGPDHKF